MNTRFKQFAFAAILLTSLSSAFAYKTNVAENPVDFYSQDELRQGFSACKQLFPKVTTLSASSVDAKWKAKELCSDDFAVLYSQLSKSPLVSVERLSSEELNSAKVPRTDDFYADPRVSAEGRAVLDDFKGSKHDRGHMAPAADRHTLNSMHQSFALTNMVMQDPVNNERIWSKIESDVRKYALRARGNVFVFSGHIFDPGFTTIGKSQVWVPTRLFKLVYDETTGKAWAYIIANAEVPIDPPVDYKTFVSITGWDFLK